MYGRVAIVTGVSRREGIGFALVRRLLVLLTSGQHLGGMPGELAYAVSKGALHQATATLSQELITRGITVNAITGQVIDSEGGFRR